MKKLMIILIIVIMVISPVISFASESTITITSVQTISKTITRMNNGIYTYLGIDHWNNEGYTGKGINIVVMDTGKLNPNNPFINHDNIVDYYGDLYDENEMTSTHMENTIQVLQQIVPDATLYPVQTVYGGGQLVKEINSKLVTASLGFYSDTPYAIMGPDSSTYVEDNNVFMNAAVGSKGKDKPSLTILDPRWFTVASIVVNDDGTFTRPEYSATGEGLDISTFTNIIINDVEKLESAPIENCVKYYHGTSASAPVVAGMVALYQQRYLELNGEYPSVENTREFIYSNCIDIGGQGYDVNYGYGMFILPKLK